MNCKKIIFIVHTYLFIIRISYNLQTIEKFCFEYFQENKCDVMETPNFLELNEDIKNIFMALPNKSDEEFSCN